MACFSSQLSFINQQPDVDINILVWKQIQSVLEVLSLVKVTFNFMDFDVMITVGLRLNFQPVTRLSKIILNSMIGAAAVRCLMYRMGGDQLGEKSGEHDQYGQWMEERRFSGP